MESLDSVYDVIVIGGGPAGLTASIYTSRAGLSTLLITKDIGGLMLWTEEIENYPGFPAPIDARVLAEQMETHAKKFGTEVVKATVEKIEETEGIKKVITDIGDFEGKSLIITSGLKHRKLNIEGENLPGVSYCAVCDGPLYQDMDVYVIGSGDSAMTDALFLSKMAKSVNVVVIHEEPKVDASDYLKKRAFARDNIKFIWNSSADGIIGEKYVKGIRVKDLKTGEIKEFPADAVFVKIGFIPNTDYLKGYVDLTDKGSVKVVDERTLETSREGVFVAGDVREKLQKQIVTAAGDGCLAAESVFRYLEEKEYESKVLGAEIAVLGFWDSSVQGSSQKAFLSELSKRLKVETVEIDVYKRKIMAEHFNVDKIPTLLVLRKGKTRIKVSERIDLEELIRKISELTDPERSFEWEGWKEVNENNFGEEVLKSEKPVVVEFWGEKCKDCLEIAPAIREISEGYSDRVKFCHFKCPSRFAVLELGVRNLPTFYIYKKGEMAKSLVKDEAKPERLKETLEEIVIHEE